MSKNINHKTRQIIKNTIKQKTNEQKMHQFLNELADDEVLAKEAEMKKVNPHKDEGEIMENELNRSVHHNKKRHFDSRQ